MMTRRTFLQTSAALAGTTFPSGRAVRGGFPDVGLTLPTPAQFVWQDCEIGATLELALPKPGKVDHVVLMEDIAAGERIQEYELEGLLAGSAWQRLCQGVSVGAICPMDLIESS